MIILSKYSSIFSLSLIIIGVSLIFPSVALAASSKPTCSLKVSVGDKVETFKKTGDVSADLGDKVEITWNSKKAKEATNSDGKEISLSGTETYFPVETTTYSYHFRSGSKKVVCEVTVNILSGSITAQSLTSSSAKPTISGTATGTKTVQIKIQKEDSNKTLFKSKVVKVKNGQWKIKVSKKLKDGVYDVVLYSSKNTNSENISSGKLIIGDEKDTAPTSTTTLAVKSIPLLFGGTVKAGTSVPVSYLQITNTGKSKATLKGFWVKQNGSANTSSIASLITVDDLGGSKAESKAVFKNGSALAVNEAILLPGQMRLFTIKAVMNSNLSAYIGQKLMLDVVSVEATSKVSGMFPIRGTTWTINN